MFSLMICLAITNNLVNSLEESPEVKQILDEARPRRLLLIPELKSGNVVAVVANLHSSR